jgi:neutral ceramidase
MEVRIGVGKHDVTGPCAGVGFMGMSSLSQKGEGIHSRLFSRAFVIEEVPQGKSVVIVCADLCMCSQAVHQAVLKKVAEHFRNTPYEGIYSKKNVLLSASHTHSGPGGYSYFMAYNASITGFKGLNFDYIVKGIFASIVKAHENKVPGKILLARGDVEDCGGNRSIKAYNNNPEEERNLYGSPVDKEMTLLKFVDHNGKTIGSINWFALHATNMGAKNRLISGDNKGYAEELFEKDKGVISAFANSCCGDNSPNMKYGLPDGIHDFERTVEFGTKQYEKAAELFDNAVDELTGSIDYRQTYVDMSHCVIDGEDGKRTWPAAMGLGMSKGSTEDSKGPGFWNEGVRRSEIGEIPRLVDTILGVLSIVYGIQWPLYLEDDYIEGQGEKPILFPWGLARDNGIAPAPYILPLQIIKLGNLALISHPGEITAMAGRRLRKTVLDILGGVGVKHAVVAAYAGAFSSYTTSEEEYEIQCYEGASTLYGPWTLRAYQQENARLAQALKNDEPVPPGPEPPDYSGKFRSRDTGVRPRKKPLGADFGEVEIQPLKTYKRGEEVVAGFWGGHPNNNFAAGESLLVIEKQEGSDWQRIYTDREFCTVFHCKKR